jgi:hypothetical protein
VADGVPEEIAARYRACRSYLDEGEVSDSGATTRFRTAFVREPFRYRVTIQQTSPAFDRSYGRGFVREEITWSDGRLFRSASSTKPTLHHVSLEMALQAHAALYPLIMTPSIIASLLLPELAVMRPTLGETIRLVTDGDLVVGIEAAMEGATRVLVRPQLDVPIDDSLLRWDPPLMVPARDFN